MQVKHLTSYGTTTTIGETGTEHVEITSTSLKLKDDTTDLVTISGTTITIGSDTDNRVTITPTSLNRFGFKWYHNGCKWCVHIQWYSKFSWFRYIWINRFIR